MKGIGIARLVPMLGIFDGAIKAFKNFFMEIWYVFYFSIVKAIAWILDMLTQLFYIFSGMTPVGGSVNSSGEIEKVDIVNFFLTRSEFQSAYLKLCLVGLALIVVFTIIKIIKQDYFERSGPRSKGPIFRNVLLSFIAFICVPIVFVFIVQLCGSLALLVMKAMGYEGGGIGTMLFNLSWEDGGQAIISEAQTKNYNNGLYDKNNFGWYKDFQTFYRFFWDSDSGSKVTQLSSGSTIPEFYWYIFLFTGLILIVNLGKMILSMLSRLYKLIALFVVAPSPISQIVLDDGAKFKKWKDSVIQEGVKVVGCVLCFMTFILVATAVNDLDIMRFAYTSDSASAANLLGSNSFATQLSNSVSALYYYGDQISFIDKAINALGRAMLLIAGVGAIQDMDSIITPLLAGGSSSMDSGNTGRAITTAAGAAAKGALSIGKAVVGGAVSMVGGAVSGAMSGGGPGAIAGAAGGALKGVKGLTDAAGGAAGGLAGAAGGGSSGGAGGSSGGAGGSSGGAASAGAAGGLADAVGGGSSGGAKDAGGAEKASAPTEGVSAPKDNGTDDASKNANANNATEGVENQKDSSTDDAAKNAGNENATEESVNGTTEGAENQKDSSADDAAKDAGNENATEESVNGVTEGVENQKDSSTDDAAKNAESSKDSDNATKDPTQIEKKGVYGQKASGDSAGAVKAKKALGVAGRITKGVFGAGKGVVGATAKTGVKVGGIMAKTLLTMCGMGAVANGIENFGKECGADCKKWAHNNLGTSDEKGKPGKVSPLGKLMLGAGSGVKNLGGKVKQGAGSLVNKAVSAPFNAAANAKENKEKDRQRTMNGKAIDSYAEKLQNTESSNEQFSKDANDLNSNADRLEQVADNMNEAYDNVSGTRNPELDCDNLQQREGDLNQAISEQNDAEQNLNAARVSQTNAEQHLTAMENLQKSVPNPGGRNNKTMKNVQKNAKEIVAISKMREKLDESYKNNTNSQEYIDKSRQLDEAYMHLTSGDDTYKSSYDSISADVTSTMKSDPDLKNAKNLKKTENVAKNSYDTSIKAIQKRCGTYVTDAKARVETAKENVSSAEERKKNADAGVGNAQNSIEELRESGTAREKMQFAKGDYQGALNELNGAMESGDATAISNARGKVADTGKKLASAAQNVQNQINSTHNEAKKQSKSNVKINKQVDKANKILSGGRDAINNVKNINGGDTSSMETRLKDTRDTLEKGINEGKAVRKIKVSGTKKSTSAKKNVDGIVKDANKMSSAQIERNKTNRQNGIGVDYEIDLSVQNGNISQELGDSYKSGIIEDNDKAFVKNVNSIPDQSDTGMSDKDLAAAISKIKSVPDDVKDENGNVPKLSDYRKDLENKYKTEAAAYKSSIEQAKSAVKEYSNTGDAVKLEAAKLAIQEAVSRKLGLDNIKIEIEKDK